MSGVKVDTVMVGWKVEEQTNNKLFVPTFEEEVDANLQGLPDCGYNGVKHMWYRKAELVTHNTG
jgi:hypothetical protein